MLSVISSDILQFQKVTSTLHHLSFQGRGLQHPPSLDRVCGSGYWDGLQLPLPRSDRLHHWHHGSDLQRPERQVRLGLEWVLRGSKLTGWHFCFDSTNYPGCLLYSDLFKLRWVFHRNAMQMTCHGGSSFVVAAQHKKWILTGSRTFVDGRNLKYYMS